MATKLAKLKTIYKIYAARYDGPAVLLAIVDGEKVTDKDGEEELGVRKTLVYGGWPKVPPNEIYNNGYVFTHIEKVPTGL